MKYILIPLLSIGLLAPVLADDQATQPESAAAPALERITWEINSCVRPETSDPCDKPSELRENDRMYLRRTFGNQMLLVTVQNSGDKITTPVVHVFSAYLEHEETIDNRRLLRVQFDDEQRDGSLIPKRLTIQHLRPRNQQDDGQKCRQLLSELSEGNLTGTPASICDTASNRDLVHWSICTLDTQNNKCAPLAADQPSTRSPPDDGQGTGSGDN